MADQYVKTPNGKLKYTFNWSDWLTEITDTIAPGSVVLTVPAGLTNGGTSITTTAVTVKLEGGTLDTRYRVDCQITTAVSGEIDERSLFLTIVEYR